MTPCAPGLGDAYDWNGVAAHVLRTPPAAWSLGPLVSFRALGVLLPAPTRFSLQTSAEAQTFQGVEAAQDLRLRRTVEGQAPQGVDQQDPQRSGACHAAQYIRAGTVCEAGGGGVTPVSSQLRPAGCHGVIWVSGLCPDSQSTRGCRVACMGAPVQRGSDVRPPPQRLHCCSGARGRGVALRGGGGYQCDGIMCAKRRARYCAGRWDGATHEVGGREGGGMHA